MYIARFPLCLGLLWGHTDRGTQLTGILQKQSGLSPSLGITHFPSLRYHRRNVFDLDQSKTHIYKKDLTLNEFPWICKAEFTSRTLNARTGNPHQILSANQAI
jgi:hypothetical protein